MGFFLTGISGIANASEGADWYWGASVGVNSISDMKQRGSNRDTNCYPDNDCSANPTVEGYQWSYNLDADSGSVLEVSIGRIFDSLRLEIAANWRKNQLSQRFISSGPLGGVQILPDPSSGYSNQSTVSVDDLLTQSLQLNAYYDFPLANSRIIPYVGAGIGISHVQLKGLSFQSEYVCTQNCDSASPENYNSSQDGDLSDDVFSIQLYAGMDYKWAENLLLGWKLSYSEVDGLRDTHMYAEHKTPDLELRTRISDMDHLSLAFGLKYLFAD